MGAEHEGVWPLTGRATELARVAVELRRRGGVVLVGDAGVGKSRLAREVVARAGATDPDVRWVSASASAREVPLGAFASVLGAADDGAGGDEAAATLSGAVAALRSSRGRPLVVVDDAHLLDDLSAALVHQLASARAARFVVTVRSSEPAPAAVTALWKDGLLARVEVEPLDERGTAELLAVALGAPMEVESHWRLHHATQGNALWLYHLVEGERAAGRLTTVAGRWRWEGKPELNPVLRDLVDAHVGELTGDLRRLLELLALAEPLGTDLLVDLVGSEVLESAAERALVVIAGDGRRYPVRLAHPLYGEVARSRLDPWRLRRRRGELVAALEATGSRRSGDVLRRATLALDSDHPVDPELLVAAGHEAALLTALPQAERFFRAACDRGGGFEAQLAYGLTLTWQVRPDEGLGELDRAVELAGTDVERVRAECHRIGAGLFLRGDTAADVRERIRHVLDTLPPGDARSDLDGVRAMVDMVSGRVDDAVALGAAVLADAGASAHAVAQGGYAVVGGRGLAGATEGLDEIADHVVAQAATRAETALMVFNIRLVQTIGVGLAGRPARAAALAAAAEPQTPGVYGAMVRAAHEAWSAFYAGQMDSAVRSFTDLRPFFPGAGGGWTTYFEATQAQARGALGDLDGAREALARAEDQRLPGMTSTEPNLALARAWVAAAEGAVSSAAEHACRAGDLACEAAQFAMEVLARHTAVCLGVTGQAERLGELAERVDGPRALLAAAHARAWERRDAAGLLSVADDLERAGLVLLAAEAAAQGAVVHRDEGRTSSAATAVARAAGLAERSGGARTPALVLAASPLALSAREREVATLAGAGLSNKEIAKRLGVSVRTVEGHVYRACHRLDIADRTALAALVVDGVGR